MRVLVTGATGVLGRRVVSHAAAGREDVLAISRSATGARGTDGVEWARWDLASEPCPDAVLAWKPSVIVHTAAMTDVDRCEREPDAARAANATATERVAQLAADTGARLLCVSTDSVFDGRRGGYRDDERPSPINVYARTKVDAERATGQVPGALVIRANFVSDERLTAWILGAAERGEEIPVFTDVVFAPLDVRDLARDLVTLAAASLTGVVHLASDEAISKAVYAERLVAAAGLGARARLARVSADTVPMRAPRPKNTSLVPSAAATRILGARTLRHAIDDYARERIARQKEGRRV